MKILVACEKSRIVASAFEAKGHDVTSCDILPAEQPGKHYLGNVLDILYNGWDMLIGFPPCDYSTFAGEGWFNIDRYGDVAMERHFKRVQALQFFYTLWKAPIPKICLENPRGYPMKYIAHSQMVHPYYFGDSNKKTTCLWLKGLPKLTYAKTDTLFESQTAAPEPQPIYIDYTGKKRYITDALTGSSKKAKEARSRFHLCFAKAMASQWGGVIYKALKWLKSVIN